MSAEHYDVVVVGSGFGGSVTALRLTEKGYRVAVLEAGDRFEDADFAANNWDLKRYLFAPAAACYGIMRIDLIKDCLIVAGAGVGGGSLVYANTLYEPLDPFYSDPAWSGITDWKSELAPYYDQAKRMLGVTTCPVTTPADDLMREVAEEMGVGHTVHPTPVGVLFGGPGDRPGDEVADPFFGGVGPSRNVCHNCGECMTGCRHNAKNTLVKNYLHLAERAGAVVHPLTTVTRVRPQSDDGPGRYVVEARWTKAKLSRRSAVKTFTADHVVFSAAALGTQKLLHRLKATGDLPGISDRLGELTRTNSESILGALAPDTEVDYSQGVAITSSWHPDERTHIEPVRFGHGSNAIAFLQTVLVAGGPGVRRRWAAELIRKLPHLTDYYDVKHWSERAVIALVMQAVDNSITVSARRTPIGWRLTSKQGHGDPNPTWLPVGHEAVKRMAARMSRDGRPGQAESASASPSADRPPRTSSAAARSVTLRPRAWSIPTSGSTATTGCTWSTGQRSPPTSA
ncbi:FAD-dependent oxidoreductase [Nocardioides cavernaquae]|uniref:FAD-dependent oxidoreductase n=1 Tax=Nocardioides cavernaquae TaxID=2321396 RepID=UPI00236791BF|nr:FAD-dependent oxidoreductase [Nocardioides cavernaquae]